jgi:aspartate/methionine/tyrosine aminotransferase
VLLELLADPATAETLAEARAAYARRRGDLTDALHARGVGTTGQDGINLWIEVADEQTAAFRLATSGVGVAFGSPFVPTRAARDHIRITSGLLRDEAGSLADLVAEAAAPPTPRTRGW